MTGMIELVSLPRRTRRPGTERGNPMRSTSAGREMRRSRARCCMRRVSCAVFQSTRVTNRLACLPAALANQAINQLTGEPSQAGPSRAQARPPPVAPQSRYRNGSQPTPTTSNNVITGKVKLRPVSDLRASLLLAFAVGCRRFPVADPSLDLRTADMFRGMWRFGVFNAIQSTCFETVSLPLTALDFCADRASLTRAVRRSTSRTPTSWSRPLPVRTLSYHCNELG